MASDDTVKDAIDNSEETEKNSFLQKLVRSRGWYDAVLFISILNLCFNLYWLNENYFDDDNLFEGSSLVADSDDVLELTSLMEEEMEVTISEEFVDEYLVLNAVRENRHLNKEEKEFFYRYIDLIKDNPYLDKERAYGSLLNFDILRMNRPETVNDDVTADYVFPDRDIRLFTDDLEKKSLAHEGIHCLFVNEKTSCLPEFFREGMTELLSNEYFSDDPYIELESYPYEICAVRMLCELTSPDTVLKAFSLGDMSYIAEEIGDIIGDYDTAVLALDALDYSFRTFRAEYDGFENPIKGSHLGEYFEDVFNRCIETKYLDDVAYKRRDYSCNYALLMYMFEDDPYMLYFDELHLWSNDKPYFSSKLKEEYLASSNTKDMLVEEAIGDAGYQKVIVNAG